MRRFLTIGLAASVFSATLGLGSSPASAVPLRAGDVYIVNGMPGPGLELCISGSGEVRGNLEYGDRHKASDVSGARRIALRRASSGACQGKIVVRSRWTFDPARSYTIVAWKQGGAVEFKRFGTSLDPTPAGQARFTLLHTADGVVDFWTERDDEPLFAAVARGAQVTELMPSVPGDSIYVVWCSRHGSLQPVVGPRIFDTDEGQSVQLITVGTRPSNSRFVVILASVGTA